MLETNISLPSKPRIVTEEDNFGVFEIDGLYPGYGHTLGNSLRRIILSSLPGSAITQIKIDGAEHEFSSLSGVKEDVINIILNLRKVRLKLHTDEAVTITLNKTGIGVVTASDIDTPTQVELLNPEQIIAEITDKDTNLNIEMKIESGLGYVPREVHEKDKVDVGTIALDAVFTPIRKANYEVENMRVGDRTDYNRLRIILETDGTYKAKEALEKSIEIMIHQLKSIVGFKEPEVSKSEADYPTVETETETETLPDSDLLKTRIETLDLTPRTIQTLEGVSVRTLGGLVRKKKDDILAIDGIGPKGLKEVETALAKLNLKLEE